MAALKGVHLVASTLFQQKLHIALEAAAAEQSEIEIETAARIRRLVQDLEVARIQGEGAEEKAASLENELESPEGNKGRGLTQSAQEIRCTIQTSCIVMLRRPCQSNYTMLWQSTATSVNANTLMKMTVANSSII